MVTMQYIKMKDSGVAWIGEIPNHWKTLRLKFASWLKGRIGWQGLKSDEYTDEGAYLITGTDFDKGRINWDTCAHITVERFNEDSDIHIQEGDLLITKDGTIGKVAIARDCPAMVSLNSGVMLIRNIRKQKYHDKYLYYILNSNQFLKWYELSQNGASTIKHLYQEQFYNFRFSYPPLPEQEAIAAYLDEKCAVIDDTIAEAKASIEEYKAWKASVIFEAVTKGLDPNAEMKDSGVEWIGKIPVGATLIKLKYLIQGYKAGPFGSALITGALLPEGGILVYTPEHIAKKSVYTDKNLFLPTERREEMSQFFVEPGDIIFPIVGSLGRAMRSTTDMPSGIINQRLAKFRLNEKLVDSSYFMWLFANSSFYSTYIDLYQRGSIIVNLTKTIVGEMPFVLPSLPTQRKIAAYLDEKCAAIDGIIAEKESLIAELETYKKSLIFETVTGKRRIV